MRAHRFVCTGLLRSTYLRAAGRECAGHGEHHHLLAGAQLRDVDLVGRRVFVQLHAGHLIAFLQADTANT